MLDKRIAELRKNKNISQEELADILNTSRQAVSKWERGETYPDIEKLKDLATFFNVSIDFLLGYDLESNSTSSFLQQIDECIENKTLYFSLDDIKIMVSKNLNNCDLLIGVVSYLENYFAIKRDEQVLDLGIEYCKRIVAIYKENRYGASLNDVHKVIVELYALQGKYAEAKKYFDTNKVYDVDMTQASIEFELGNYDKASEIVSENYLKSISCILNGLITKARLFIRQNNNKEAYEVCKWAIDFVKSIGKNEDVLIEVVFILNFVMTACKKNIGLDYKEDLKFLKDNRDALFLNKADTESIKFYNKKVSFFVMMKDMDTTLYEEIEKIKGFDCYEDFLYIYKEVYGEK